MIEKIKNFFRNYKDKLTKSAAYKKFLKKRDEIAEWMRLKLLAVFSLLSPIYTFLCIKTLDPGQPSEISTNEISQVIDNSLSKRIFSDP